MRTHPTITLPKPGEIVAPAYFPRALRAREQFLRGAAEAWRTAGDDRTAALLARDADAQRGRHQEN